MPCGCGGIKVLIEIKQRWNLCNGYKADYFINTDAGQMLMGGQLCEI